MTKKEMVSIISGEKPADEAMNDEKAPFSHKCCHVTGEQAKRLSEMAFLEDQQESCRRLSHFIGENLNDERIKSALQGCVVCIGRIFNLFEFSILKECIAFSNEGYITYKLHIGSHGISLGIDENAKLKLNPWPDGVFKDGYMGLTVRLRKKVLMERAEKCKFGLFVPCSDDEIADVILKGIAEVTA